MNRGILIAGNESPLFSAFCAEAARRQAVYAAAAVPRAENSQAPQNDSSAGQFVLDWNPPSPVSAKTLILSAQNKMNQIDDAILICVPPAYRKNAEDFSAEEIDQFVDNNIKGWFFLVRELTMVFKARGQGNLSLVLPADLNAGSKDEQVDLAGPVAVSAFYSFAQGMLQTSLNAPYHVLGFSFPEPGAENDFAAYVFKTMEEGKKNSGKWHKYGKFGFLGR